MKCVGIAGLGLVLGLSQFASAQETAPPANQPPPYTLSRWDEDYRYLRDPGDGPRDTFDPIKYIPLTKNGNIWLSLGGQVRYRFEYFDDFNFGAGPGDDDGHHLLRILAHADLHLGDNFRIFVQGKSALIDDREGGPRPTDADEADIQQAFAEGFFRFDNNRNSIMIRGGRQEMAYGAERLIGYSDWTNVRRTFDGVRGSLAVGRHTLDLFWVRPVIIDKESLNETDDDTDFAGIYYVVNLPRLIEEGDRTKLDLYVLWLGTDGEGVAALDSDTFTVGAHFFTNPVPWDLDMEADYQFGEFGDGDISAWSFAIEGGYSMVRQTWQPRVFLGFDIASGDDDPTDGDRETFNQLFPSGHPYFGYIDAIGRQNIIDVHPGLIINVSRTVNLRFEQHLFWRESDRDAVYNAAGVPIVTGGSSAAFIGSEFDFLFSWQLDRHWQVYAGYSHFWAGDFIEDSGEASGAHQDIDFFYAALTFTF
jgi:hypothetical protein